MPGRLCMDRARSSTSATADFTAGGAPVRTHSSTEPAVSSSILEANSKAASLFFAALGITKTAPPASLPHRLNSGQGAMAQRPDCDGANFGRNWVIQLDRSDPPMDPSAKAGCQSGLQSSTGREMPEVLN